MSVSPRMKRFRANPASYRNNLAHVDRLRKRRMAALIEAKGGKCERCGYNRCSAALEFHHRDPSQKRFALSLPRMTAKWESILLEALKCDLLCANCHREEHHGTEGGVQGGQTVPKTAPRQR